MYCMGIVNGVSQIMAIQGAAALGSTLHICPPEEATINQYIRIILKYLNDNPAKLHQSNVLLIADVLKDAYPCE